MLHSWWPNFGLSFKILSQLQGGTLTPLCPGLILHGVDKLPQISCLLTYVSSRTIYFFSLSPKAWVLHVSDKPFVALVSWEMEKQLMKSRALLSATWFRERLWFWQSCLWVGYSAVSQVLELDSWLGKTTERNGNVPWWQGCRSSPWSIFSPLLHFVLFESACKLTALTSA